jgi:uroporphyrinogen decarboxylase
MNARENFQRILQFNQPERVIQHLPVYSLSYYGMDHQGFEGGGHDSPVGSRWTDIWGTGWHKIHADVMGMPEINPLANPADVDGYSWPDPDNPRLVEQIYERARAYPGGDMLLAASHRDTLWEKAYMLVGMENMMVYFLERPEFARRVLRRIMDFQLGIARHYLSLGVEMVFLGDDLGTQQGPLLGPRIVGRFLKPEYQRLFDLYRSRGVLIGFHSCGCLASVLEMFMELGVDLLNPVQATANDLDHVRRITQGRMALQGGVSSATLMEGPAERIVAEVRERLWQLGRAGGYVCQPDQGMPYPEEHLRVLDEAVKTYGRYPIPKHTD